MKIKDIPMAKKKLYTVLLHALFLLLSVAGISAMYLNSHYGSGLGWLLHETYEDTSEFTRHLKNDIDSIFNYINYKDVFETDGKLDFKKVMLRTSSGPGEEQTFTLEEMVRHAKSRGLYLNEKFKITGQPTMDTEESDIMLAIEWSAFNPDSEYEEPSDAYANMDSLAEEVLTHLGNYYSFHYKFMQNPSNLHFRISYADTDADYRMYTNTANESIDAFKAMGKYIYVTGDSVIVDNNVNSAPRNITSLLEANNPYDNSKYYMIVAVDTSYPYPDSYASEARAYDLTRVLYIAGIVALCIGLLGCAITLYYLIHVSGLEENGSTAIRLHSFDEIPTEGCFVLGLIAIFCGLFLGEKIGYRMLHLFLSEGTWYFAERILRVLILYAVCMAGAFSLLRRYKARAIWQNSLTRKTVSSFRLYLEHHSFTTRLGICYTFFVLYHLVVISSFVILCFHHETIYAKILLILLAVILVGFDFWIFHQMYKNALQNDKINDSIVKISEGDTAYKIDTSWFSGKEKEMADNINHISTGLEVALQEQVKSERLKADLITNVSHDIKTPLTSIINYVDLIKREHIQDPKIQGYLDVLEQKAQRLKTLTEDLVEASKASSGNLKLEVSQIDLIELIQQAHGEFEEKFALRHLELITTLPDDDITIEADGRHLWRVLENLYNNAFKYAMEHSRIYVDLAEHDGQVTFTIKNISENPLNINPDELTERFVRGDVSRATEGSGLGLSIAKSLTELQKGGFEIIIDGDLFKVLITFPIIPQPHLYLP